MARLLIHLSTGPEHPTRASLAFLIARLAQQKGHEVSLFLAGDAVALLRDETMDLVHGIGTGRLRESFDALAADGARFFASGLSSKARALDTAALNGKPVEFAPPDRLVDLVFEVDRVISY